MTHRPEREEDPGVFCPTSETRPGLSTVTLERDGTTIVIRDVPGEVCDTCGEAYYDAETTDRLLKQAERACQDGITVEMRNYRKAA